LFKLIFSVGIYLIAILSSMMPTATDTLKLLILPGGLIL